MRHKTAAEKGPGGGWHYVSLSRHGGHPLGYCAKHAPHPTEGEARDCYGQWVRDSIKLNAHRCRWTSCEARPDGKRCENPAQDVAEYGDDGYGSVALCSEHMTVEHVIAAGHLAGPAGDAWVS